LCACAFASIGSEFPNALVGAVGGPVDQAVQEISSPEMLSAEMVALAGDKEPAAIGRR
jgi:hypothetical protein